MASKEWIRELLKYSSSISLTKLKKTRFARSIGLSKNFKSQYLPEHNKQHVYKNNLFSNEFVLSFCREREEHVTQMTHTDFTEIQISQILSAQLGENQTTTCLIAAYIQFYKKQTGKQIFSKPEKIDQSKQIPKCKIEKIK